MIWTRSTICLSLATALVLLLEPVEANLSIGRLGHMLTGPKRSQRSLSADEVHFLQASDLAKRSPSPVSIEFPPCMRDSHEKLMALKGQMKELEAQIELEMDSLRQCAFQNI